MYLLYAKPLPAMISNVLPTYTDCSNVFIYFVQKFYEISKAHEHGGKKLNVCIENGNSFFLDRSGK